VAQIFSRNRNMEPCKEARQVLFATDPEPCVPKPPCLCPYRWYRTRLPSLATRTHIGSGRITCICPTSVRRSPADVPSSDSAWVTPVDGRALAPQEVGLSGSVGCSASRCHRLPEEGDEGGLIAQMLPEASECASD
jgi:hypothetical protein